MLGNFPPAPPLRIIHKLFNPPVAWLHVGPDVPVSIHAECEQNEKVGESRGELLNRGEAQLHGERIDKDECQYLVSLTCPRNMT